MLKNVLTIVLVLATFICKAQHIAYSENTISGTTPASIIGQVKDNIIVWYKGADNYTKSVILVYDNRMKLVTKETTGILHSDIDPAASFYNSGDSFYVAYQYQTGSTWEYKLAGFDQSGHLSSSYIIDSTNNLNTADSVAYNYYQSPDKKTLACVKTIFNERSHALQFAFSFLQEGHLYRDQLVLGFDDVHEKLAAIQIDDNKNISFLKTQNTDSGFIISVIKKAFASSDLLITAKKLPAGILLDGTSHFFDKNNIYTIYGVWKNASGDSLSTSKKHTTGLYTWKLNKQLADMPGDTILYDDSTTISAINRYASGAATAKPTDFFGIVTDSVPIPDPHPYKPHRELSWQGTLDGRTLFLNYIESNAPAVPAYQHYKADLTIINLSNKNTIVWRTELEKERDKLLLTDLSNNIVIAGKKGIHIVRSTNSKKVGNTIEHILINYDGDYEQLNTVAWSNKYTYLFSYGVTTKDGALILPCIKHDMVTFAKMVLE